MNKSIIKKTETVNKVTDLINANSANSYQRLLATSAATTLDAMKLSKAVKAYLETAEKFLTEKQLKIVTFKAVLDSVKASEKYVNQEYFSFHEITLIANKLIKDNDKNVQRAERAAKQQVKANKK
jgi:hypothetical protein